MQSIRNFFHTETWWGKTIFIILIYALYWCLFYWTLFLIPEDFFVTYNISGYVTLFYGILLIPSLSFFIPHFFKNLFSINKTFLYVLHTFIILFFIALFLTMIVISALSNF